MYRRLVDIVLAKGTIFEDAQNIKKITKKTKHNNSAAVIGD